MRPILCTALLLFCLAPWAAQAQDGLSRIYGKIVTDDGDTFEGLIRWDKNEVSWVDVLDGTKQSYRPGRMENANMRRRARRSESKESGIRFGHIQRLERVSGNKALIVLRGGDEVEFTGGATDIGSDIRGIIVEDDQRGEVELQWRDVDYVEFMAGTNSLKSYYGTRIFGTLETRDGDRYKGFICWDIDEVLTADVLDGDDRNRRRRKIKFGNISRIERDSGSSALVVLRNGDELELRGTNDVNSSNSDILVMDPGLGQVRVEWNDLDFVEFEPKPADFGYEDFMPVAPLYGTITTDDGDKFTGFVQWDRDEAYTWELLNGEMDDIDFKVEFGLIESIERDGRGALVTLRDGRELELEGSNDVSSSNDGIAVLLDDGDEVVIRWRDFDRAVFHSR